MDTSRYEEELANRIQELLREMLQMSGMNMKQVADVMDVTRGNVRQLLNRDDPNPTARSLARFAAVCGFEVVVDIVPIKDWVKPV